MLSKHVAIAVMAAIGLSQAASAALVVDQSQTAAFQGNLLAYGPTQSNLPLGQSITAGMTGRLGAFDIAANRYSDLLSGAGAALTLEIRAGNGLGGTLLGTTTQTLACNLDVGFGSSAPCGARFALTPLRINVVAGQQYTLLITAGSGDGTVFQYGLLGTAQWAPPSDRYAGGQQYAALFPDAGVQDLTFRTLIDDAVSGVPEPSSWALLITGFGLTGAALRRRRRALA